MRRTTRRHPLAAYALATGFVGSTVVLASSMIGLFSIPSIWLFVASVVAGYRAGAPEVK